jgi:Zn-dependent metalloprotease
VKKKTSNANAAINGQLNQDIDINYHGHSGSMSDSIADIQATVVSESVYKQTR